MPPVTDVPILRILVDFVSHAVIRHNGLYVRMNTNSNDDVMNVQPHQGLLENGATRPSKGVYHTTMKRQNKSNDSGWYRKQYLLLSLPINTRYEFLLFASIDLES